MTENLSSEQFEKRGQELIAEGYSLVADPDALLNPELAQVYTKGEKELVLRARPNQTSTQYEAVDREGTVHGTFTLYVGVGTYPYAEQPSCKLLYKDNSGNVTERNIGTNR